MDLKDLPLKKVYSTDSDNVLYDFYIPALEVSVEYCRLAGFFSSTSLAVAATGILGLIKNSGSMKIVVSSRLSKRDVDTIMESQGSPEQFIAERMLNDLDRLEDEFVKDHIFALGWMIANKRLKIKVAIAVDDGGRIIPEGELLQAGLFHPKVGILKDSQGNIVTFSGSINETRAAWLDNIEEFKVFRSWDLSQEQYLRNDIANFDRFWNNRASRTRVIDVPTAVEEKLIQMAPESPQESRLSRWYRRPKQKVRLFGYQEEAIEKWLNNGKHGIFAMATGTGKTFTALGCASKTSEATEQLLTVITCPLSHLIQQWRRAIDTFGLNFDSLIIADGSNPTWRRDFLNSIIDIGLGHKNKVIVLTSHRTFSSAGFINIIQDNKGDIKSLLIADEAHGVGAEQSRNGLIDAYEYRLGLSATPKRWFDIIGTGTIYDYFGDEVFEFSLEKAINTINPATGDTYLTPYRYVPKFLSLTGEELEEFVQKSRAIVRSFGAAKNDLEKEELLKTLLFKRADIVKNAEAKYEILDRLLDELGPSIKWTIIYCSPEQIDTVMDIANKHVKAAHRFTEAEATTPTKKYHGLSERDNILKKFGEGKFQVLVAMKCLDEGVDIPPARTSILVSSSGNPREYIQRIGRVIRRYPDKREATIYDLVVTPSLNKLPKELRSMEQRIFASELRRYEEIARTAINNAEALELIYNIKASISGH